MQRTANGPNNHNKGTNSHTVVSYSIVRYGCEYEDSVNKVYNILFHGNHSTLPLLSRHVYVKP